MTGLPRQYIRHPDGTIEQVTDIARYAEWFNNPKNRIIDKTAVPYGDDFKQAVIVSTVFLGFEHGIFEGKPLLWETLAEMPGDIDELGQRYTSEVKAKEGHEQIVLQVQARLNVDEEELEKLLKDIVGVPVPRPRKAKDPKRKLPDPNCQRCGGTGEERGAFLPGTFCECTVVLRKKNADG